MLTTDRPHVVQNMAETILRCWQRRAHTTSTVPKLGTAVCPGTQGSESEPQLEHGSLECSDNEETRPFGGEQIDCA